jgi:hypothetical protein
VEIVQKLYRTPATDKQSATVAVLRIRIATGGSREEPVN